MGGLQHPLATTDSCHLICVPAAGLKPLGGYASERYVKLKDIQVDSGKELGRGFLLAFAMLLMLRRIEPGSILALELMSKSAPA